MNQMGPFAYSGILIDDFWLYFYDNRYYNLTLLTILETVNKIEETKWTFLNYATKVPIRDTSMPISDYTQYSNEKHHEIDGVDDTFPRGCF